MKLSNKLIRALLEGRKRNVVRVKLPRSTR